MAKAVFTAKLEQTEKTGSASLIRVPVDVRAIFGKARPPVRITVKKHTFRSTVMVYGGKSYIGINTANCAAAKVRGGDTVRIRIESDDAPRVVRPPADLAKALAKSPRAKAKWDALSFTHKREHAEAIASAKKPETRARRLAATLAMLEK